jgi:hypothetical protein
LLFSAFPLLIQKNGKLAHIPLKGFLRNGRIACIPLMFRYNGLNFTGIKIYKLIMESMLITGRE